MGMLKKDGRSRGLHKAWMEKFQPPLSGFAKGVGRRHRCKQARFNYLKMHTRVWRKKTKPLFYTGKKLDVEKVVRYLRETKEFS